MANPQAEDGHVDIANEIVEALARMRLSGEEGQCLWVIFRKTYGWKKLEDRISLSQFAVMTGLKKQHVHRALTKLSSKKVIAIIKKDDGQINYFKFIKDFDKWEPSPKKVTPSPFLVKGITKIGKAPSPFLVNTKETTTKDTLTKEKTYSSSGTPEASQGPSDPKDLKLKIPPLPPPKTKSPKVPECPHREILSLYHSILPELTQMKIWNELRAKHLKARWREDPARQNLEWWGAFFQKIKESDFLMGRASKFIADLEWMIKPQNFAKILDGKYINRDLPVPKEPEAQKTRHSGRCIDGTYEFDDGKPSQLFEIKWGKKELEEERRKKEQCQDSNL